MVQELEDCIKNSSVKLSLIAAQDSEHFVTVTQNMFHPHFLVYVIHLITYREPSPIQCVRVRIQDLVRMRVISVFPNTTDILIDEINKFDLDGPLSTDNTPLYLQLRQPLSSMLARLLLHNYGINHDVLRDIIHGEWNKIVAGLAFRQRQASQQERLAYLLSDKQRWIKTPSEQLESLDIYTELYGEQGTVFKRRLYKIYGDYFTHTNEEKRETDKEE